ncbi:hypothetical protein [Streptomyces sp. NPDC057702]|uniref:hypothetical protein n=1 Tax=Streptomyces sp. NPDC057702 TaxID=3346221 RepID=UPI00369FBD7E
MAGRVGGVGEAGEVGGGGAVDGGRDVLADGSDGVWVTLGAIHPPDERRLAVLAVFQPADADGTPSAPAPAAFTLGAHLAPPTPDLAEVSRRTEVLDAVDAVATALLGAEPTATPAAVAAHAAHALRRHLADWVIIDWTDRAPTTPTTSHAPDAPATRPPASPSADALPHAAAPTGTNPPPPEPADPARTPTAVAAPASEPAASAAPVTPTDADTPVSAEVGTDTDPEVSTGADPEVSTGAGPEVSTDADPEVSTGAGPEVGAEARPRAGAGGAPRRLVVRGPDGRGELVSAVAAREPADSPLVAAVVRTGASALQVRPEDVGAFGLDAEGAPVLVSAEVTSLLCVPLRVAADGPVRGALTLFRTGARRAFEMAEAGAVDRTARHLALALDRAARPTATAASPTGPLGAAR